MLRLFYACMALFIMLTSADLFLRSICRVCMHSSHAPFGMLVLVAMLSRLVLAIQRDVRSPPDLSLSLSPPRSLPPSCSRRTYLTPFPFLPTADQNSRARFSCPPSHTRAHPHARTSPLTHTPLTPAHQPTHNHATSTPTPSPTYPLQA